MRCLAKAFRAKPRIRPTPFDPATQMHPAFLSKLPALLAGALLPLALAGGAHAEKITGPFAYPTGLLDAPATLTTPLGRDARIGKPRIVLESTRLEDLAAMTGATRLSEGDGVFRRDTLCLTGTTHGKPMIVWFIATDSDFVTEAQLEWAGERTVPEICRRLDAEHLPVQIGRIGLGMESALVNELLGRASYKDEAGWHYWFSQRFLRNKRGLQELELNWLAVHYDDDGLVDKTFSSQVTNL